jgi:hypothetical protein
MSRANYGSGKFEFVVLNDILPGVPGLREMIPRVARPARCLRRASTSPVSRRLRTNDGVSRTLTAFLVDRYHSLPRSYSYASCRTLARGLPTRAGAKIVTTRYAVQLHGTDNGAF